MVRLYIITLKFHRDQLLQASQSRHWMTAQETVLESVTFVDRLRWQAVS